GLGVELVRDLAEPEERRAEQAADRPDMGIKAFGNGNVEQIGEACKNSGDAACEKQKRKPREHYGKGQADTEKPEGPRSAPAKKRRDEDEAAERGQKRPHEGLRRQIQPDEAEAEKGGKDGAAMVHPPV